MITVIEQPTDAVLARNDVKYKLLTDNNIISGGTKARIVLSVDSFSNAGTITLNFMGKTYVFNSTSGTDDNSGLQYHNGIGFTDYLLYGIEFVSWLERNFDLNSNYEIVLTAAFPTFFIIDIKARKVGTKYDITASSTAANIAFTVLATGVDAIYRERFKILHDVFLEQTFGAENYKLLFSGSGVPDASNYVEFNFTDVLRSALQLHTPVFAGSIFYLNNAVKRFYTRHAESFGFPTTVKSYKKTSVKMAFLGAQKFVSAAQMQFTTNYITSKKFLTAMPQNTVVTKEQKQYLSCYVNEPVALQFYVRLFYTDGTFGNYLSDPAMDITAEGVYTFECGYESLAIDINKDAGKTVSRYIVELYAFGEPYASEQAFVVDNYNYLFNRYVLFFNSFGMPETMYFSGKQTDTVQLKSDLVRNANLQADTENAIYDGEMAEINNELQFGYELNSGWKSKEWVQYFNDFLLSRKRYLQATDKWIGLNIPAQKVALLEDDKYNYAIKFTYQDSFIEKGIAE